jgi:hypothetical protein
MRVMTWKAPLKNVRHRRREVARTGQDASIWDEDARQLCISPLI